MSVLLETYSVIQLGASIAPAGEYIGAVGNLISAVLQTAGLYAQTDVLLFYKEALTSLAAVLFIFSIAGALTSIAIFGSYKNATYFLIGPLLFYAMLTGLTTAKPTSLQVGQRIDAAADEVQQQLLSVYLGEDSDVYTREIQLSWFFVMFDNLVTNVSQNIIATLIDEDNKKDIVNVARERVFSEVFGARNTDQNLLELTSIGLVGECSDALGQYLRVAQPRTREVIDANKGDATQKTLDEIAKQMHVQNINLPNSLKKRLVAQVDPQKLQAIGIDQQTINNWATVASKQVHSCYDVWTFAQVLSQLQAQDRINEIKTRGDNSESSDVPWDKVIAELETTLGKELPENQREHALREVLATNLFKTTLRGTNHSKLMTRLNAHSGFKSDETLFDDVFAGHYGNEAQSAIGRLAMFGAMIPYLQGLFLFALSAAFPFFCIFLVIPERMNSFFTWMWLWVWVKSWDIGFATIHVIRDILWEWLGKIAAPYLARDMPNYAGPGSLLPADGSDDLSALVIRTEYVAVNWDDPSAVLHAALSADPMANVSTYHILISALTMMVPFLTAHICRGAGHVLSAFQASFSNFAETFGNSYGNRIEQYSGNAMGDALAQSATAQALIDTRKFLQMKGNTPEVQGMIEQINQGLKTGNLTDFALRGDGTMAAMARAFYQQRRIEAGYAMMELQMRRGIFVGRQTLWDNGHGQKLGQFDGALLSDQFVGRMPYQVGDFPGASGKPGTTGGSATGGNMGQTDGFSIKDESKAPAAGDD